MISDRRPATTIGELDIHLGFLLEELTQMREQQERMVQMLATKTELAELRRDLEGQIKNGSFSAFWRRLTEIAVGITAVCTAVGFVFAVLNFLGPALRK
jgi:hypothetical protein